MSRDVHDVRVPERDQRTAPAMQIAGHAGDIERGGDDRHALTVRDGRAQAAVERSAGDRERTLEVSARAERTVLEIGTFRALRLDDLARYGYDGDHSAMARDLRRLRHLGLVSQHRLSVRRGRAIDVVVLTQAGRAWGERRPSAESERGRQTLHAGLVKPREVAHDLAIYRMYQAERARLAGEGGRVRRVLLDYELKRRMFSAPDRPNGRRPEQPLHEATAAAQGLRVIDGKIAFPDLRIEYENANGEMGRVDLELTTEHYKAGQLRAKAEAGFRIYVAGPPSARMAAVFEERDITVAILEL